MLVLAADFVVVVFFVVVVVIDENMHDEIILFNPRGKVRFENYFALLD